MTVSSDTVTTVPFCDVRLMTAGAGGPSPAGSVTEVEGATVLEQADSVTFLFTDLEASTRLWEQDPAEMRDALAAHNAHIERVAKTHGGRVVKYTGDGALAAFGTVGQAAAAALDAQRALEGHASRHIGPLRARMAIHMAQLDDLRTGCYESDGDYLGPALHRCARLMATAHGGQILLSERAAAVVAIDPETTVGLRDLGRHRLRDLADREHVFQLIHPDLWSEFPPLRSVDSFPGNLPKQATSFIGRRRELAELADLVDRSQLVTLVGVGGVGKTRHAVHTAARLVQGYEHGAWLVDLAPIADPQIVPVAVASTLRIRERKGEAISDTICHHLADRSLLLVVDNCEHVIDAASELIVAMCEAAPGLRCMATSREALRVRGEHVWQVPTLSLPAAGSGLSLSDAGSCEAVQLFADRARAGDHRFVLDQRNIDAVVGLCRRLDGLPLAIELAAVRAAVMSPAEILRRLDARFALLTQCRRDEASHHQTLRDAIDWSHDLLGPNEQKLFRRLSTFAGGWTMADAEATASGAGVDAVEVLDLLAGLVRKSMVVVTTTDGQTRYGLLESLRAYARERLIEVGEEDEYRDRFARCFFDRVVGLQRDITGPGQAVAYAAIGSEFDNIRATLDWFVSRGQADRALRLVRVLRTYLAEYRPTEGFRWALDAVAIGDAVAPQVLAGGLADAAWIGYLGERSEALTLARRSVEVAEAAGLDPDPEALRPLALEAMYAGDMAASLRHFERATAVARRADDLFEVAAAQTGVCFLRTLVGDREGAVEAGEEAVALGRLAGFDTQIAGGLAALGFAFGGVDAERSAALLEESLDLKGDTTYSAVAKAVLAHLRLLLGQLPQALHLFRQVLDVHRTFGDRFFVPMSLEGMASIFALVGHPESAARMLGGAAVAREKLELPGLEIELELRSGAEALVAASLEPESYAEQCERGRTWTLEETIEFGLAEAAIVPGLDLCEAPERQAMVSV